MVQGVLYVGDDKKLTNAAELCIICQWEWKIWGAGTSIKDAISTWQYWTVGISHPLRGISEGQTHALWFFTFCFLLGFLVPLSILSLCFKVIISWWIEGYFLVVPSFSTLSLCPLVDAEMFQVWHSELPRKKSATAHILIGYNACDFIFIQVTYQSDS